MNIWGFFVNKITTLCIVSIFLFIRTINCSQALKFTIEPKDVVVPEGNSVLLPCDGVAPLAKYKPNVSIRWRGPDGQDIGIVGDTFRAQFDNGTLYISSVEENRGLTGTYQCLLSADGIGTIVSRSARVSIAKLPETNHLFSELYLYSRQTAYLKCLTSSIEPGIKYEVQWLKNETPLRIDESRMTLFPSGSIEIDELTSLDSGSYQCNVTSGSINKLSSKTNLNVKDEKQITQSPAFLSESSSQIVREGDNVILECTANGSPKPQMKWLRNGEDIDISDLDSRFRIIGTGSLQISQITESDYGNYQCRASNSADSIDIEASIQIQSSPRFLEEPQDQLAQSKEELELVCAIRGKPTPIINWLKNGDIITPNEYMQIVNGHNLRILGLITSDAGMFQCVGSNSAGSVQAAARLEIFDSVNEIKKFKAIAAKAAGQKTLPSSSSSSSSSSPTEKNKKSLSKNVFESLLSQDKNKKQNDANGFDKNINKNKNKNLNKSNNNKNDDEIDENDDDDDDAEYDYDERQNYDQDDEGTILPIGPNEDLKKLLTTYTDKDEEFDEDDDDENQQQKNHQRKFKTPLHNNKNTEISYFSQSPNAAVTRKYPNLDGRQQSEIPIPGPPRDLVAQIVNPRLVSLSWMEPLKNPDEVTSYTIYYKMTTSERERKIATKSRDEQMISIQSLLPGKTYQFRVVGNSNNGLGESSNIYEMTTQPEENIAGPPEDVQVIVLSHQEIHLSWKQPLLINGNITKYTVYYSEEDGVDLFIDSQLEQVHLINLRPFTEYTISVVAYNQNGIGVPSNEIIVKTFSSTPQEPPINVTLETTSSTSIIIRWEPPLKEDQNGQITGYKLRYRKLKKQVQVETTPANVRHYELKGLDKMTAYQVKIAAMTVNGTGPFTEWYHIETYENDLIETHVPGQPLWLKTRATAESIFVQWAPPTRQDIKIRGYQLTWGLGIPDVDSSTLDENARSYEITDLEPDNDYVISLRARNLMGDGPPIYENVRTRDEDPIEQPRPLKVPLGLRAVTMSPTSIVVYWSDNTRNQGSGSGGGGGGGGGGNGGLSGGGLDSRQYVVRYNIAGTNRYKYYNTTDLNCMIGDLRVKTQYEFAVKVVKGRRESEWSMSVLNSTDEAETNSPPRDLQVRNDEQKQYLILEWLSPKHNSVPINGYVVFYTTDPQLRDRDWNVEAVVGEKECHMIIKNLKPLTTYYFKVQTRSIKNQLGPFSAMVSHTTTNAIVTAHGTDGFSVGKLTNEMLIYLVIGIAATVFIFAVAIVLVLCRRKTTPTTPEHTKQSYHKNNAGIKPPDLWIHHDQMELKNVDKNNTHQHQNATTTPGYSDGASSSGAMTLPRSVNHEYDNENVTSGSIICNSLDKRSYVPGYMTTSMNSSMERSQYPRTQYSNRAHVSVDPTLSQQNLMQSQGSSSMAQTPEPTYGYDAMTPNYSNPSVTYAPGLAVDAPKRTQGHPLKSFSVPGPPSSAQILSNANKHNVPAVTIRPQNSSPYKKSSSPNVLAASSVTGLSNRLQGGPSVTHSTDEIQRLAPSTSTEELNQEMANLEGLMKDLSAITANEFEC